MKNTRIEELKDMVIEDYQNRWWAGEDPDLEEALDGLPSEEADEIREDVEAWKMLMKLSGVPDDLASRPPRELRWAALLKQFVTRRAQLPKGNLYHRSRHYVLDMMRSFGRIIEARRSLLRFATAVASLLLLTHFLWATWDHFINTPHHEIKLNSPSGRKVLSILSTSRQTAYRTTIVDENAHSDEALTVWMPMNNQPLPFIAALAIGEPASDSENHKARGTNGRSVHKDNVRIVEVRSVLQVKSTVFVGTTEAGVFYSDNYGESWKPINEGLPFKIPTQKVSTLAAIGTTLYAGTPAGVFRLDKGQNYWIPTELVGQDILSLFVSQSTLYAGTDEGAYRLIDEKWKLIPDLLGPVSTFMEEGTTLFAMVTDLGIFRSDDGGNSWGPTNSEQEKYLRIRKVTVHGFSHSDAQPALKHEL